MDLFSFSIFQRLSQGLPSTSDYMVRVNQAVGINPVFTLELTNKLVCHDIFVESIQMVVSRLNLPGINSLFTLLTNIMAW